MGQSPVTDCCCDEDEDDAAVCAAAAALLIFGCFGKGGSTIVFGVSAGGSPAVGSVRGLPFCFFLCNLGAGFVQPCAVSEVFFGPHPPFFARLAFKKAWRMGTNCNLLRGRAFWFDLGSATLRGGPRGACLRGGGSPAGCCVVCCAGFPRQFVVVWRWKLLRLSWVP